MSEEEGLGEVLIDNFSFFLTNKCTITDYSQLTEDELKRFLDSQADDFIRYIYLSTASSTSQAIYTGYPDGNFYQSGGEIDYFVKQQLECAENAANGGSDISAYDPRQRPWYIAAQENQLGEADFIAYSSSDGEYLYFTLATRIMDSNGDYLGTFGIDYDVN